MEKYEINMIDDWKLIKILNERESSFIPFIKETISEFKSLYIGMGKVFFDYTQHDINHSLRVMNYMYELIDDISFFNDFEIVLIIYSALLHDIGMAVCDDTLIKEIREDKCKFSDIKFSVLMKNYSNEKKALQDYIRRIHAKLSSEYIIHNLKEKMKIPYSSSLYFYEDVALICRSHNEDINWIKSNIKSYNEKGEFIYNAQYIALLLRIADLLDIDQRRAPLFLYNIINPKGIDNAEWKQHFIITNYNKIQFDNKIKRKKIIFTGVSKEPSIHRKILTYIEWINNELKNSIKLTTEMEDKYWLKIENTIENNIHTENFTFSNLKLKVNFNSITSLIMGENIYGNSILGLRELLQNSIDACEIKNEQINNHLKFGDEKYFPKIKIILDKNENKIIIRDNGIGMTLYVIENYFLNIGTSYYTSDDYLLKGYNYKPIGNFGIGFLSCFMLSDKITINTRHYKNTIKYKLELEKLSEYICITQKEDVSFEGGTEIILDYSQFINSLRNNDDLTLSNYSLLSLYIKDYIKNNFIPNNIKFEIIDTENMLELIAFDDDLTNLIQEENKIDISEYFNDINCSLVYQPYDLNIVEDFISYISTKYTVYYNGYKVSDISKIDYKKIIDNNFNSKLKYIQLYLVNPSGDDDINNKMQNLRHNNTVTIFVPKELYSNLKSISPLDYNTKIVGELTLQDLLNYLKLTAGTVGTSLREHYIIHNKSYSNFLIINQQSKIKSKIYVRSVLIKNSQLNFSDIMNFIDCNIMVNIRNNNIKTTITREKIDTSDEKELGYAIEKAILLEAIKSFNITFEEKKFIKTYLDNHFNKYNKFLKSNFSKY